MDAAGHFQLQQYGAQSLAGEAGARDQDVDRRRGMIYLTENGRHCFIQA